LETATGGFGQKPGHDPVDFDVLSELFASLPVGIYVWQLEDPADPAAMRLLYANAASVTATGIAIEDVVGMLVRDAFPGIRDEVLRIKHEAAMGGPGRSLGEDHYSDPRIGSRTFSTAIVPLSGRRVAVVFSDVTAERLAQERARAALEADRLQITGERDRLASAVAQAAESVEMTDADGRITYVNPAFERSTGYSREEVVGQNPRLLQSGVQSPAVYKAMWAALTSGIPWIGDLVNRRKDGSLMTEEAVISPIRDEAGVVSAYVAVKRDVTRERALEHQSAELVRERAIIGDTIRSLGAGDTPEVTARAICRQIIGFRRIVAATIYLFELDGRAMPLSFVIAGEPDPPLLRLPRARSRFLAERAAEGPWIEPWTNRPGHPYNRLLVGLGNHLSAFAPVRNDGHVIGVLVVDAAPSVNEAAMADAIPAVVEFASLASALIGHQVAGRTEHGRGHARIARIIKRGLFSPVFQPIVNLARGSIVGYEALSRFNDGVAPDIRFAEAEGVGLGRELEAVTLETAVLAATVLPRTAFLNLNVSPAMILQVGVLAPILARTRRRIVLEVTEHAIVEDYAVFHEAVRALGPRIRLAVDDAGAGYSSLRHVVELRPVFVKVDRALVAALDADPSRQAMIAGLKHFAVASGCQLIAEGIETAAELAMLRALGISLGQGFLTGPPMSAEDAARAGTG